MPLSATILSFSVQRVQQRSGGGIGFGKQELTGRMTQLQQPCRVLGDADLGRSGGGQAQGKGNTSAGAAPGLRGGQKLCILPPGEWSPPLLCNWGLLPPCQPSWALSDT